LLKRAELCIPQKKIHPSAVSFHHSREAVLRDPYAFQRLRENTVFSRSIRQQKASENRTTSYGFETNNRRSGPKGRGFESRHFDQKQKPATLINQWVAGFSRLDAAKGNCPVNAPYFALLSTSTVNKKEAPRGGFFRVLMKTFG